MAEIKPFYCVRPAKGLAEYVAALPYDVFNRQEAKEEAKRDSRSFLNIDRAEIHFEDNVDSSSECVYQKAKQLLEMQRQEGIFIRDEQKCYYIYELGRNGRVQTGIVACASIDNYINNVIRKHENTREEKEQDRIRHVLACNAQTGPIFLAYRAKKEVAELTDQVKQSEPLYSFISSDNISHRVWRISDSCTVEKLYIIFQNIDRIYIADGHHRAASAVKVGLKLRQEHPDYQGTEEFNYFLSVLFPDEQLMILSYNRIIKDLNGLQKEEFLEKVAVSFTIQKMNNKPYQPFEKSKFGMYIEEEWYCLTFKHNLDSSFDPVKSLDVSILQDYLLGPILGIKDPRIDKRIDFVGGIRGLEELEKRIKSDGKVAFSLYPTTMQELFGVSDAGKLMPPKSTWFEPKLRSGLFIHELF